MNPGIVARDVVVAFTAVDQVPIVMAIGHAVTTDHIVITRLGVDAIPTLAADDDIFTSTRQNEVVSAEVGGLSGNRREHKVRRECIQRQLSQPDTPGDLAMVAKDQVVSTACCDSIIGRACNNQIVTRSAGDVVVAANCWVDRFDRLDSSISREEGSSIVTQDNVVTAGRRD